MHLPPEAACGGAVDETPMGIRFGEQLKILCTDQDTQGAIYADTQPQVTAFAKELMAPGTTTEK